MSHHKKIYIVDPLSNNPNVLTHVGHVRIRNDGVILSVWINTEHQGMLFLPEHPELIGEEEFVQTGNGTVAQRLRELEEEE